MASIKTKTKKALPRAARTAKSIVKRSIKRNAGSFGDDAMKYAVPAAASAVGIGMLVGGYLMRGQLSGTARTARRAATSVAKQITFDNVLDMMGMQRRRSIWATALPGFGMLAVGLIAGSAFATWLSPEIKGALEKAAESTTNHVSAGSDFVTGGVGMSEQHPHV